MTHTVTETAAMLGYSSVFAFSRAFKTGTGCSPTAYLRERRK